MNKQKMILALATMMILLFSMMGIAGAAATITPSTETPIVGEEITFTVGTTLEGLEATISTTGLTYLSNTGLGNTTHAITVPGVGTAYTYRVSAQEGETVSFVLSDVQEADDQGNEVEGQRVTWMGTAQRAAAPTEAPTQTPSTEPSPSEQPSASQTAAPPTGDPQQPTESTVPTTSYLSSGQKQRLGIARALAKDTDIIIADEPTGNLDAENGAAVMKMLYELSKDKLVIVVTHNFEQVQEYASRKIRLFDGEIAEDLKLKPELYKDGVFKEISEREQEDIEIEKDQSFGKAVRFVKMNRKAQPHRTFFIFTILTVTIASFFIMYGYFLSSLDDTTTKSISDEVFCNTDNRRLIVRKSDGSAFTDEDIEELADIRYVRYVDRYDYANEISCLYEKDEDYLVEYKKMENTSHKSITVEAKDYSDFVSLASGLSKRELKAGSLPQEKYEVALASSDESLIGETVDIYFKSKKWSDNTYLGGTFTVTGIIDEDLKKPYFSDKLLKSMNVNYGNTKIEVHYQIEKKNVYDDPGKEDLISYLDRKTRVILVEGEGLTGNQIRLSEAITMNIRTEGYSAIDQMIYETMCQNGTVKNVTDSENEISYEVEVVNDSHGGSSNVAEVSHEFLEQVYGSTDVKQVSVYMDDYAYADRVIKSINAKDYEAVSVYRISAGEYNSELVQERMSTILMSAGSVVVIFVLSILVIYVMMRLKRNDFVILKLLGLSQKTINKMNYYELITGSLAITAILILVFAAAGEYKLRAVSSLVKYYTLGDYVFVTALALCMSVITAVLFNRHLNKFLGGKR